LRLLKDDKWSHKTIRLVEVISSGFKKHLKMKSISKTSCNASENIKLLRWVIGLSKQLQTD
ncbi:10289_t:CDS:1, partial [Racocetra persica]